MLTDGGAWRRSFRKIWWLDARAIGPCVLRRMGHELTRCLSLNYLAIRMAQLAKQCDEDKVEEKKGEEYLQSRDPKVVSRGRGDQSSFRSQYQSNFTIQDQRPYR